MHAVDTAIRPEIQKYYFPPLNQRWSVVLETLSQAAPPASSGAGILFFCADAIGIPPKEKKTIVKRSSIIVRGERLEKD